MIARTGADLVLHGHNHVGSVAFVAGPAGPIPIIGAPSASAQSIREGHRAAYYLFDVVREGSRFAVTATERGLTDDGTIGALGPLALTP